jgi:hypothetical protein
LSKALTFGGLLAALWLSGGSTQAHHAIPLKVDRKNPVTLNGIVKQFRLQNPHASLFLTVRDENGKSVDWTLEGGPVRGFVLMGFTEETLPAGQSVLVVAYPSVEGNRVGQLFSITLPDGKKYGGGPNLPP